MAIEVDDPVAPPDAVLVRRRWISPGKVEWAKDCDRILMKHHSVHGRKVYPSRHVARWRATKLIQLMTDLGLHERWELKERTSRTADGWVWAVEYVGGHKDDD